VPPTHCFSRTLYKPHCTPNCVLRSLIETLFETPMSLSLSPPPLTVSPSLCLLSLSLALTASSHCVSAHCLSLLPPPLTVSPSLCLVWDEWRQVVRAINLAPRMGSLMRGSSEALVRVTVAEQREQVRFELFRIVLCELSFGGTNNASA
jgi:hypothetical protein